MHRFHCLKALYVENHVGLEMTLKGHLKVIQGRGLLLLSSNIFGHIWLCC